MRAEVLKYVAVNLVDGQDQVLPLTLGGVG